MRDVVLNVVVLMRRRALRLAHKKNFPSQLLRSAYVRIRTYTNHADAFSNRTANKSVHTHSTYTQPTHTHTTLTLDTTILVIGCCMCVVLFRSFQRLSRMRATSARRVRTNCKHKHRADQLNTTPHCVCVLYQMVIYIYVDYYFIYD